VKRRSANWDHSSRCTHPDREVEEIRVGATAGALRGRTEEQGAERGSDSDALYEEIGRLKVELDWLKKKVGMLD